MKMIVGWVALAMLPALHAQSLAGNWQGTLEAGQQKLRLVFRIALDNDKLKATLHSIDQQGAPALASTSVSKDGSMVKITFAGVGGYDGKLSADGNSLTGAWSQGTPLPLNLVRATADTAWAIPESAPPPARMAANADPAFAAATIKPSAPGTQGKVFTLRGQDPITVNTSLSDLVTMSYGVHPKQLVGAPAWMETDKYDVTGRPDTPGQPSVDQMKIMLQKMVADRFQFKFHREKRELSVYAITVLKSGAKIARSQADPNGLPGLTFSPAPPGMMFNVRNATIEQAAGVLQGNVLDKPVVDQTRLSGKYDFSVKFMPDPSQMNGFGLRPAAADVPDAPPDLFAAFQQQLGLKLESAKAPVDVLVIDKVEKPSDN